MDYRTALLPNAANPTRRISGYNLDPDKHKETSWAGPDYREMVSDLREYNKLRVSFLKSCFSKLGLEVDEEKRILLPDLSEMHLSSLRPQDKATLLWSWQNMAGQDDQGRRLIQGGHDTFTLEEPPAPFPDAEDPTPSSRSLWSREQSLFLTTTSQTAIPNRNASGRGGTPDHTADFDHIIKRIVYHEKKWPSDLYTPDFDHTVFYQRLEESRREEQSSPKWDQLGIKGEWGNVFMYGRVLTSTNSLLDKYEFFFFFCFSDVSP